MQRLENRDTRIELCYWAYDRKFPISKQKFATSRNFRERSECEVGEDPAISYNTAICINLLVGGSTGSAPFNLASLGIWAVNSRSNYRLIRDYVPENSSKKLLGMSIPY